MTDIEIKAAIALENCTFLPGSFDKRWCHQLGNWYGRRMTPKGSQMMIKLVKKYRRQIPDYEDIWAGLMKENSAKVVKSTSDDRRQCVPGAPDTSSD